MRTHSDYFKSILGIALLMSTIGACRVAAQGATGTILGTVTDTSGAAIAEASVEVKNIATGIAQSAMSDALGRFRVPDLGVSDYEIQVSKMGFSTVLRKGITLTVGSQTVLDFALSVGQQQQTITVEGQASQVETTNATVGSLVDQQQMRELPLNGRNFEQLIILAPGVQSYSSFTPSAMQGRANSYSVAGGRPEGQALLLDDQSIQTFWNRGMGSVTGTSLGVDAIAEFQTLTNTYSAQFGGNGAVVNAVSRSGSNGFHGSAFDFLRNSALDARNFFDPAVLPAFRKNQFGGSLGGPVKKNKAFFFVNYEGIRQLLGETKVAFVPAADNRKVTATNSLTAQAIAGAVALYPLPDPGTTNSSGIGSSTQVANQTAHENYILGRFDYTLTDKDSIFGRYISDKADLVEPFSGGGGQLPLWPESDFSLYQFLAIEERRIISPTLVNVLHADYVRPTSGASLVSTYAPLQIFPGSGRGDAVISVSGISGLGGNNFVPLRQVQNRFTEGDDILWTRGAHSLKFGMAVSRIDSDVFYETGYGTSWTFQSLTQFLAGQATTMRGVPLGGYPNRDWRETDLTPYVQDDWKLNSKLNVNLGLRWEFMTNPVDHHNQLFVIKDFAHDAGFSKVPQVFASNPSLKNFDPRVGFAYDPSKDHKISIRAGFGIFHDPIVASTYFSHFSNSPPSASLQQQNPTYPFPFSSITPSLPTANVGWNWTNHTTPYMIQYNLNIQREIGAGTIASIGYVGSRGVHLLTSQDQSPPIPQIDSTGTYHFASLINGRIVTNPRVNPNLSYYPALVENTTSNYNSLQASLNRRFTRNVQAQAAYTYSKCMEDGSNGATSFNTNSSGVYENPYLRSVDYSVCSFDIKHTFRLNGLIAIPFRGNRLIEGWQFSGIVAASTGLPLTIATGFDQAGMQGGPNRPNLNPSYSPNPIVGTVNKWFDPAAFSVQPVGTLGNVGRNTVIGPKLVNTDVALMKETRIPKISEGFAIQFRAEVFNLFNHANFGLPGASIFTQQTDSQGRVTGGGNLNTQAGRIINTVTPSRQIQMGLKLVF